MFKWPVKKNILMMMCVEKVNILFNIIVFNILSLENYNAYTQYNNNIIVDTFIIQ